VECCAKACLFCRNSHLTWTRLRTESAFKETRQSSGAESRYALKPTRCPIDGILGNWFFAARAIFQEPDLSGSIPRNVLPPAGFNQLDIAWPFDVSGRRDCLILD